jgi:hypothetical protein
MPVEDALAADPASASITTTPSRGAQRLCYIGQLERRALMIARTLFSRQARLKA